MISTPEIPDSFKNDVESIIANLPIKRLNKKYKIKKSKKKSENFIVNSWTGRDKLEKNIVKCWFIVSIITFFAGILSVKINININARIIMSLLYVLFSFIVLTLYMINLIFGDYYKRRNRESEINSIIEKSWYFSESITRISALKFESNEDSIKVVKEILMRNLNRMKYIKEISPIIIGVLTILMIIMLYISYGDSVLDFFRPWNIGSNNDKKELPVSIDSILKSAFVAAIAFMAKILFHVIFQPEISTLESCVSILESAESLRKERLLEDTKV
jgi:hypothetical protein